jgi:DNA-directed RNA polymerase
VAISWKARLIAQIVKRPVMSYFYGSERGGFTKDGPYGMVKQVHDVLKDREIPHHFQRQSWSTGVKACADTIYKRMAAKLLARMIYEVIEEMVPRAKEARDRLKQLAELCAKENKPLRWTTSLGLPIQNRYHKPEIKNISVPLNGRRRCVKFVVGDKETIDKRKAVNAVTANFVHSADAVHLMLIALAAAKEGIDMVSVHDCFGCLAVRQTFQ